MLRIGSSQVLKPEPASFPEYPFLKVTIPNHLVNYIAIQPVPRNRQRRVTAHFLHGIEGERQRLCREHSSDPKKPQSAVRFIELPRSCRKVSRRYCGVA